MCPGGCIKILTIISANHVEPSQCYRQHIAIFFYIISPYLKVHKIAEANNKFTTNEGLTIKRLFDNYCFLNVLKVEEDTVSKPNFG